MFLTPLFRRLRLQIEAYRWRTGHTGRAYRRAVERQQRAAAMSRHPAGRRRP